MDCDNDLLLTIKLYLSRCRALIIPHGFMYGLIGRVELSHAQWLGIPTRTDLAKAWVSSQRGRWDRNPKAMMVLYEYEAVLVRTAMHAGYITLDLNEAAVVHELGGTEALVKLALERGYDGSP
jgi:hypothetical protein